MTREGWAIAIIWLILLVGLGFTIYFVYVTSMKFGPPIIAGIFTLLVAVITHALAETRELRVKRVDLKQKNYQNLLGQLSEYINDPTSTVANDKFDRVIMYSWVVGSEEVIEATQRLKNSDALNSDNFEILFQAMRKDIGLPSVSKNISPELFLNKIQ